MRGTVGDGVGETVAILAQAGPRSDGAVGPMLTSWASFAHRPQLYGTSGSRASPCWLVDECCGPTPPPPTSRISPGFVAEDRCRVPAHLIDLAEQFIAALLRTSWRLPCARRRAVRGGLLPLARPPILGGSQCLRLARRHLRALLHTQERESRVCVCVCEDARRPDHNIGISSAAGAAGVCLRRLLQRHRSETRSSRRPWYRASCLRAAMTAPTRRSSHWRLLQRSFLRVRLRPGFRRGSGVPRLRPWRLHDLHSCSPRRRHCLSRHARRRHPHRPWSAFRRRCSQPYLKGFTHYFRPYTRRRSSERWSEPMERFGIPCATTALQFAQGKALALR